MVFDGSPPELKKKYALANREATRQKNQMALEEAKKRNDVQAIRLLERRLIKPTTIHMEELKQLFDIYGVPWVQAMGEAEAQCAKIVKEGKRKMFIFWSKKHFFHPQISSFGKVVSIFYFIRFGVRCVKHGHRHSGVWFTHIYTI